MLETSLQPPDLQVAIILILFTVGFLTSAYVTYVFTKFFVMPIIGMIRGK